MLKKYFSYICLLISLLIITDFVIPTHGINDEILQIEQTRENYFNAGGNSHMSYQLVTKNKSTIYISKNFKANCRINENIKIHKSLIFDEVNKVSISNGTITEIYSLRYFSGIVLPSLYCIVMLLKLKYNKIASLNIIVQILLLGNLIYIIFN